MSTNLLEQQETLQIKIAESEEELSALRKKVETLEEYKMSNKVRVVALSILTHVLCSPILGFIYFQTGGN